MYSLDLHFKTDPELAVITEQFALSQDLFLSELAEAWTLLMNADMFDGPLGNRCHHSDNSSAASLTLSTFLTSLILFASKLVLF